MTENTTLSWETAKCHARHALRNLEKARNDASTKIEIGLREAYAEKRRKAPGWRRWLMPKIAPDRFIRTTTVNALGMNRSGYLQFFFDHEIESLAKFSDQCRQSKGEVALEPEIRKILETHGGLAPIQNHD